VNHFFERKGRQDFAKGAGVLYEKPIQRLLDERKKLCFLKQ